MPKCRNYLIVGAPDAGKSLWAHRQFDGKKVFYRRTDSHPFEGYLGEDVVVYDDVVPKLEELLDCSNIWSSQKHVFGATRYAPTFWGPRARVIVLMLNKDKVPGWASWDVFPRSDEFSKFAARFNIIEYCGDVHSDGRADPSGQFSDWRAAVPVADGAPQ